MSYRAQQVLETLMKFDAECEFRFPMTVIAGFLDKYNSGEPDYWTIAADYDSLTAKEERQVIEAFLKHSY